MRIEISNHLLRLSVAAIACLLISQASAQESTLLPGGATSLREIHGDWVVSCAVTGQGSQASKSCLMSQEQHQASSGQRIIAIEIQPSANGSTATLIMPFGLNLAAGVALQVDKGERSGPLPFRTCLPVGCVVSLTIDDEMLAALRGGTTLAVFARPDGGAETTLAVSLRGFSGALTRTTALSE